MMSNNQRLVALVALAIANSSVASAATHAAGSEIDYHDAAKLQAIIGDTPTHHLGKQSAHRRQRQAQTEAGAKEADHVRELRDGESGIQQRTLKTSKSSKASKSEVDECDPETVNLADYPQWRAEEGYWIGDYTFYGADGQPFSSATWNYRYDSYKGFITGNVEGNAYRQRNVFFYPPQIAEECAVNDSVVGTGTCGVNGNTKVFEADQAAMMCSTNPELGGDISGPFAGIFATTTELVGADNAVLYQVLLGDSIFQSQLTTLTETPDGVMRRTRTAQSFAGGVPINASFFRERKVDKATFYAEMQAIITAYNIQVSDTCTWVDNFDPANGGPVIDSGLEAGIAGCMAHLETSFEL